jgi:hypothetical protein
LRKKVFSARKMPKKPAQGENDLEHVPVAFDSKGIFKKAFAYKELNEELLDVDIKYLSRFSIAEDINSVCHRKKIVEMVMRLQFSFFPSEN